MKVSVITINYNDKGGLEKTLNSVLAQNPDLLEYIVVDGGSTDGSAEAMEAVKDRLAWCVSEKDKGIYNAMNKGLEHASGDYCVFMNSGDVFADAEVLDRFVAFCKGEDIICGHADLGESVKKAPAAVTMNTLFEGSICHQSAFIKTSLMKAHPYDETLKIVADRKFFLQAFIEENCSYACMDSIVVRYDITGFSAQNPVRSRLEYDSVLEEMIPQRIRADYAAMNGRAIYGDTPYEKFFSEVGLRNYRKPVYALSRCFVGLVALFKKSASFVKQFPHKI